MKTAFTLVYASYVQSTEEVFGRCDHGRVVRYYRRMTRVKELLNLLGVERPIIQAPMAGVSTPELAAAVSNSGGLGSLGVGASNVAQARVMIRATRALTARAFNVNLFCHRRARASQSHV